MEMSKISEMYPGWWLAEQVIPKYIDAIQGVAVEFTDFGCVCFMRFNGTPPLLSPIYHKDVYEKVKGIMEEYALDLTPYQDQILTDEQKTEIKNAIVEFQAQKAVELGISLTDKLKLEFGLLN